MPLRLNVGLSKKVGMPNYGSLGASCHVEVELDQSLVFDNVEAFQERITHAYAACRQAVTDELGRQLNASNGRAVNGHATNGEVPSQASPECQQTSGQSNGHNGHRATQKQLDFALQLAGEIRGLGVHRLESISQKMFDKPLADLSSVDASGLIDVLKDIKGGKIELAVALNSVVD